MEYKPDPFRPVNRRRRVLIALLAVATALWVAWAMTRKWGIVRSAHQHPADVAACAPGQTGDCVGSKTSVIAVPAAPTVPSSSADIIAPSSR